VRFTPYDFVIAAKAVKSKAVVMLHNHPSGDPTPSSADFDSTRFMVGFLGEHGIQLKAHAVVSSSGTLFVGVDAGVHGRTIEGGMRIAGEPCPNCDRINTHLDGCPVGW
jgi:hypothetical protein